MFKSGNIPWNKGVPRTDQEITNIKKGFSEKGRQNKSKIMKKRWDEGKYDIMYGNTNPSTRPEVAEKIGIANSLRIVKQSTKDKISKSRLGKPGNPVSEKHKKEYSERMKVDNPMFRKEVLANHPVLKSGSTYFSKGEEILYDLFKERGIKFIHQKQIKKNKGYYTVDFFFPNENKIIEFDGFGTHINSESDKLRDLYLLITYKYKTLRIISKELNIINRKNLISKINTFLEI